MRGLGRSILNTIYKALFPLKCTKCRKEGSFLCAQCESKLRYLDPLIQGGLGRVECLLSCFPYEDPISQLIILGKYSFMPEVFSRLGKLASGHIKKQGPDLAKFTLCPIPLSLQRQRWRGFNQSQMLGDALNAGLGLPIQRYLIRQRNTKTQKDLARQNRLKNVKNCFAVNPKCTQTIRGQSILLIDDVATTGATLGAASEILLNAGAKTVWALTIARD